MSVKGEFISDFDDSAKSYNPVNSEGPIDFSVATKLEGNTGSTCDVYVAQYHQTKVLVKKLKPRLRNKVLYKNALEKEFTLGFRLKHNGLPIYREFHNDSIIMEFIEGDNLHTLLQRKDPWLSKESNVRKLLTQLLDVVNYLHENNVSHCDIKADNIILTKGHRNIVLIDLDKTYTAYYPNSAGSTSHFDVESSKLGSPDVDFHGIGKLVDRIIRTFPSLPVKKFRKFEAKCMGNNVQADDLLEWLQSSSSHNGKNSNKRKGKSGELIGFSGMIACMIILAVVGLVLDSRDRESAEPILTPIPLEEHQLLITQPEVSSSQQKRTKPLIENEDINVREHENEKESYKREEDSYKKEIERQMASRILPLISAVEEGRVVLEKTNSTDKELRDVIFKLLDKKSEIVQTAYSDFENQYPAIEPLEIQMAVVNAKSFRKLSKETDELIQKITDEIVARNPESYSTER